MMKRDFLKRAGILIATALFSVAVNAQETGGAIKLTLDDALKIALSENPTSKVAE